MSIKVKPEKCTGCLICQLQCSLAYTGAFNPEKSRILIEPLKEISFTDDCVQNRVGYYPPPCQAACPLHVDVKGYITLISQGKFKDALRLIRENLPFPGIIARVCTHPCEAECKRAEVDEAIAIAALKRYVADHVEEIRWQGIDEKREERTAIIGSGPAGLMAAYDLRKKGYPVTIFEAAPQSGGLLRYGIPEYRLPKRVLDNEISYIQELGVNIKTNTPVKSLEDIFNQGYGAIFLATGAGVSQKMGVSNEDAKGVIHALDFLKQVSLGVKVDLGQRVAVIGGGNAAVDAARVAHRLGVTEISIVYRRSRVEMPAVSTEVDEAEREGVKLHVLAAPVRILTKDERVTGIQCIRMELREPDASGRRRPVLIKGSEFNMDVDSVILAIGQALDPALIVDTGINLSKTGTISVNPVTLETECPRVFAGGDAVTGPASVINALAAGRKAAISIDRYLKGHDLTISREGEGAQKSKLVVDIQGVARKERVAIPTLALDKRIGNFQEVELGLNREEAIKEAERCLSCECKFCVKYCAFGALEVV